MEPLLVLSRQEKPVWFVWSQELDSILVGPFLFGICYDSTIPLKILESTTWGYSEITVLSYTIFYASL